MPLWLIVILALLAIGIIKAIVEAIVLFFASIPIWIYILVFGLLATYWILLLCGHEPVDEARRWWNGLPYNRRTNIRKACWKALAGLVLLALAEYFPVIILTGVGLVLAIRWAAHRVSGHPLKWRG